MFSNSSGRVFSRPVPLILPLFLTLQPSESWAMKMLFLCGQQPWPIPMVPYLFLFLTPGIKSMWKARWVYLQTTSGVWSLSNTSPATIPVLRPRQILPGYHHALLMDVSNSTIFSTQAAQVHFKIWAIPCPPSAKTVQGSPVHSDSVQLLWWPVRQPSLWPPLSSTRSVPSLRAGLRGRRPQGLCSLPLIPTRFASASPSELCTDCLSEATPQECAAPPPPGHGIPNSLCPASVFCITYHFLKYFTIYLLWVWFIICLSLSEHARYWTGTCRAERYSTENKHSTDNQLNQWLWRS